MHWIEQHNLKVKEYNKLRRDYENLKHQLAGLHAQKVSS